MARAVPAATTTRAAIIEARDVPGRSSWVFAFSAASFSPSIAPERAIAWALSQPVSTVVTGIDSLEVLEQNVRVAREFAPMSADEAQELLTMAAPHARDGHLERYKTG